MFVYIAGPYIAATYAEVDTHIVSARMWAAALATHCIPFVCPHLNSAHFEVITPMVTQKKWLSMYLEILKQASAILLLPGWRASTGTMAEIAAVDIPKFTTTEVNQLVAWWRDQ